MGNQQYIPEPPLVEEKRRIYQSQVLIPISISGKTYAMLGPLSYTTTNPDSLKEFFPTYHHYKPIDNGEKPRANDEIEIAENPHPDNQSTPSIEKST